jgi:hypothetical protein
MPPSCARKLRQRARQLRQSAPVGQTASCGALATPGKSCSARSHLDRQSLRNTQRRSCRRAVIHVMQPDWECVPAPGCCPAPCSSLVINARDEPAGPRRLALRPRCTMPLRRRLPDLRLPVPRTHLQGPVRERARLSQTRSPALIRRAASSYFIDGHASPAFRHSLRRHNLARTSPKNPTHSQNDATSRQNLVNNEMTFQLAKISKGGRAVDGAALTSGGRPAAASTLVFRSSFPSSPALAVQLSSKLTLTPKAVPDSDGFLRPSSPPAPWLRRLRRSSFLRGQREVPAEFPRELA